jgi:mannitol/fructose-specific phosphotransferase system IIA component (Ntr-type)
MNPEDFPDGTIPMHGLSAANQWQAISELLDHLVSAGKIRRWHRAEIEKAVARRESSMSTAIGSGMAVPHATTDLVGEPVAIFGRSRKGIRFDAPDKKPVFKVCLFLMPKGQFQRHLNYLSAMAKLLAKMDG